MGTVAAVVFDEFQALDLTGPLDVLHAATVLGADPGYETVIVSAGRRTVCAANGLSVNADRTLRQLGSDHDPIDTLLVVGGLGTRRLIDDQPTLDQLAALAPRCSRLAAVCTGSLILAAAGLLDGYRATTHWASCATFADRYPAVDVLPDQIYVQDRDRWTSAGVTAGVDLALALVEHDHSAELAHRVAGWLVVFVRRPGGQAQFSAQLRAQPAQSPGIAELQRWLPDHLDSDLTVEVLARRAGMSVRTFARAFRHETGTTPAAFVESLRVEAGRRLLEATDLTVGAVARQVGLRHAETLHRAFNRRVGTTPDRYRQHFHHQAAG